MAHPIAIVVAVAGVLAALLLMLRIGARRRRRAEDARLRSAPIEALAAEAARAVRLAGWDQWAEGAALQVRATWSERELLEALDALWRALIAEDTRRGRGGRDANAFDFHDFGLASISLALRDRLALPHPEQSHARGEGSG